MTTYATRTPLQLLTNTYYMMTEESTSNRRSSARLKVKEEAFIATGTENTKQNGVSKQIKSSAKNGTMTRSKRKIDYDEEDNGFKFARAKSKRTKAAPATLQQGPAGIDSYSESKPNARRSSRRKSDEDRDNSIVSDGATSPHRNTRHAATRLAKQNNILTPPKHLARQMFSEKDRSTEEFQLENTEDQEAEQAAKHEPTKIALPFADTPVIRRNKEMRKGNNESRRSSLSMRGRRASSLIDSGTSSALPHDQVETKDFYKHIESTLLEPRRMRQLLMWCGSRALGEKPSFATEDSPTKLAARQIQQELLKDLASKAELSDWFSREDIPAPPKVLKPNPQNIANLAKIQELETKITALKAEHQQWIQLQKPPAPETITIDPLPAIASLSLTSIPQAGASSSSAIQKLTSTTQSSSTDFSASIQQRLETVKTNFELNLDKLLDSVNALGQHLSSAEATSKHVLGSVAKVLEEKDRRVIEEQGSVGTRDALRALTRVLDRG